MWNIAGMSLTAVLFALSVAATQARANPHVWVETGVTFELEDHRVTGLAFTWRFDDYYSSHALRTHDLDGNGALESAEREKLRAESFDPLARYGYHVHVWAGGEGLEGLGVDRFSARLEEQRLVYEFSVPIAPPADPNEAPVIVSLFDRRNEVDFRFGKEDFLRVDGELRADCKFRIARGRGEQSGHPQPVTLRCGGER